ncbi:ExbD/TolR family protein [Marinibactrum halimedae]|uniref:Biopolymer transporter ExbD n=1 Tax=Marinibactrum halimedae TaxID=1444977 RepID=A0AA37TAZ9_9GAMM|nr:biopolymer transporter ExbD [Marinibactrum halimedae]MCD9458272.1 biopolymer transporter ExbD [Marinibactrum halimedae]GLS27101.1 hypothetical protein GCM10007877_28200 [Marinibactrum halimedae]
MKQSLRAKRMAKHHRRLGGANKLNLVSLMDIFTILVFFLLVNSSDVEVLQNNEAITLPESVAEQKPESTLVIMASAEDIIVSGRSLVKVPELLMSPDSDISALAEELKYVAQRAGPLTELEQEKGRAVTIMADETTPYALLKKIMSTCATNDYRDISFAVSQVPTKDLDPSTLPLGPGGESLPSGTGGDTPAVDTGMEG